MMLKRLAVNTSIGTARRTFHTRRVMNAVTSDQPSSVDAKHSATTAAASTSSDATIIEIDGSYGEGGGQLIRNASALAAILAQNIHLTNIRKNRQPKSGLQRQHLTSLQLLHEASSGGGQNSRDATTANHGFSYENLGSTEICFMGSNNYQLLQAHQQREQEKDDSASSPNQRKGPTEIVGDTQSAGSICLLLQAVLPYAIFAATTSDAIKFTLKGGTNAAMAPQYDYFEHVFLPTLMRCGNIPEDSIRTNLVSRGFYPKGGGHVEVTVKSPIINKSDWKMPPMQLTERGEIVTITVRSFTAGKCHPSMGKKLATVAKKYVQERLSGGATETNVPVIDTVVEHFANCVGSGCGILMVAETSTGCLLGGSAIGNRKIPIVDTAKLAAKELMDAIEGGGCVDDYLQDQLILYMALANDMSQITTNCVTRHTQTAIWLAEQLCEAVTFEVIPLGGQVKGGKGFAATAEALAERASGYDHFEGKIAGLHLIRCHGIGYCREASKE